MHVAQRSPEMRRNLRGTPVRGSHLDLGRAPYVLYGVEYVDPAS